MLRATKRKSTIDDDAPRCGMRHITARMFRLRGLRYCQNSKQQLFVPKGTS
ncbi:hypothetical protein J6590_064475 [Homalodisca vitripennis]|nr:hypothetical protein J6590_064475 [Homalodisca vitripennis]